MGGEGVFERKGERGGDEVVQGSGFGVGAGGAKGGEGWDELDGGGEWRCHGGWD